MMLVAQRALGETVVELAIVLWDLLFLYKERGHLRTLGREAKATLIIEDTKQSTEMSPPILFAPKMYQLKRSPLSIKNSTRPLNQSIQVHAYLGDIAGLVPDTRNKMSQ